MKKSYAYVLITTLAGYVFTIRDALEAKSSWVLRVDIVTGPYDLVALIVEDNAEKLTERVVKEINGMPGISRTTTSLVESGTKGNDSQQES